MTKIAFIGLGTMGLPMALNLHAAGHDVAGVDLSEEARAAYAAAGGAATSDGQAAVAEAETVITMLPEGRHLREIYETAVEPAARPGTLLVDCSTIDVVTSRALSAAAERRGWQMIDAPVSGGVEAARAGGLSFMVGGAERAVARARPLLEVMGSKIHHFGGPGSGQAAKACHNMICGITALGVYEAFALAVRLDLDPEQFFELCRGAAAQSWILENRCPLPGLAPDAPASNDYKPGFAARLMAKDLRLAQDAAEACGQATPFGAEAARRFAEFAEGGDGDLDFSAIYRVVAATGLKT